MGESLTELRARWNNPDWAASDEFISRMVALVDETDGAVLECGSGLTTLVLHEKLRDTKRPFEALEHEREWFVKLWDILGDRRPLIQWAPLLGDPPFYRVPYAWDYGLVILDGPPGSVSHGRRGFFREFGRRLKSRARILMDDYKRPAERASVEEWVGLGLCRVVEDYGQFVELEV